MRENEVEFEKQIFSTFLSDSHLRMHRPANSKSNKKVGSYSLVINLSDSRYWNRVRGLILALRTVNFAGPRQEKIFDSPA